MGAESRWTKGAAVTASVLKWTVMEQFDAGNGISEESKEGLRKTLEWMKDHPDALRDFAERDRLEWPKKRRKIIKYLRALERGGAARIPNGLTTHDISRAQSDFVSLKKQKEAQWAVIGKIANVAAIVGSLAAVATLVITILLGWFV